MRKVRFQKTGPFRSKSKIGNFFKDKKLNSPGAFFFSFKNIISAKLKALNFAPYLQEIKFSLQSSVILQIAGSRDSPVFCIFLSTENLHFTSRTFGQFSVSLRLFSGSSFLSSFLLQLHFLHKFFFLSPYTTWLLSSKLPLFLTSFSLRIDLRFLFPSFPRSSHFIFIFSHVF